MVNIPHNLLKVIWKNCDFSVIVNFSSVDKELRNYIKNFLFKKNSKSLNFWENYKYPCKWLLKKIDKNSIPEDFMKIVNQIEKILKDKINCISVIKKNNFLKIFEQSPKRAIEKYFHLFSPEIFKLDINFSLNGYIQGRTFLMTSKDMETLMKFSNFGEGYIPLVLKFTPPEVVHTFLTHWTDVINMNLFEYILSFHNTRSEKLLPIVINYYENKNDTVPKLLDINLKTFNFHKITIEKDLLKEMYKRGCLDSYLDKFRYIKYSHLIGILNLDLDISHDLFKFAKNIFNGKSFDMPYGYLIPDSIFELAIEKKVDVQIIRKMLEFNLKQKLSSKQIDVFYEYFRSEHKFSLFNLDTKIEILYFLQNYLNKFILIYNKSLKNRRIDFLYFFNQILKYIPDFINSKELIPQRVDLDWDLLWQEEPPPFLPTSSKDFENNENKSLSEGQVLPDPSRLNFEKTSPLCERPSRVPKRREDKRVVEDELPNSHSKDDQYSWFEDLTVNASDFLAITNNKRKRLDQKKGKKIPKV